MKKKPQALKNFLKNVCENYKGVFYVPGNHEYYGTTMKSVRERLKTMEREIKTLHILDNTELEIEDVVILGSTLWSHVPSYYRSPVKGHMSDYVSIRFGDRYLSIDDTNEFHKKSVAWLEDRLEAWKGKGKKVVVLTHHAPMFEGTSDPKYNASMTTCAFASNLRRLVKDPVTLWAFGHTHWCSHQKIGNTWVVSNCIGYGDEGVGGRLGYRLRV